MEKEMKKTFEQLTPENRKILSLVAQGMQVSQQSQNKETPKKCVGLI